MRATVLAAALVLSALPTPAAAQLANHAISVESGVSTPLHGRAAPGAAFALSATAWIDGFDRGDLEGVLRVALASAPQTVGRASTAVLATGGLRLSLGRAPLRPQLFADLGWARLRGGTAGDRVAYGLGAGLEWFPVPDLSVAARAALRGAGAALGAEGVLGLAAYF
ncbi:MAG TPA: hypothetical protein VFL83_23500 [Anaeromyxobacter sp.]|nr:hypothetical protein [Anaeromyxobacter sp.]